MELKYYLIRFVIWLVNFAGNVAFTLFSIRIYRCTYDKVLGRLRDDTCQIVLKDPALKKRLRMLCNYMDNDSGYSLVGRMLMSARYTNALNMSVNLQNLLHKEPEIRKIEIVRPVFMLNLPRTGSNLLGDLMDRDLQFWEPRKWELFQTDNLKVDKPSKVFPMQIFFPESKFGHLHKFDPQRLEDGMKLLEGRLLGIHNLIYNPIYAESHWNESWENLVKDCESMKEALQIIIAHRNIDMTDRRLFLKVHCNVLNVKALLEVFPDAQIIMGHRDLTNVVASSASYMFTLESIYVDHHNQDFFAQQENWNQGRCGAEYVKQVHATLEERTKNGLPVHNLFTDYSYKNLMKDTMGTMQELYNRLGVKLTPDVKLSMQNWLENNRQDKHGRHVYTLEQFGLTQEDVDREWKVYQEEFKDYL